MEHSKTYHAVVKAIQALGITPDEVANTLRAKGIKGYHEAEVLSDPISYYLIHMIGNDSAYAQKYIECAEVVIDHLDTGEPEEVYDLPSHVFEFWNRFNNGCFADLRK